MAKSWKDVEKAAERVATRHQAASEQHGRATDKAEQHLTTAEWARGHAAQARKH